MSDASQFTSVSLPSTVNAGVPFTGSVRVKNTGDTTWTASAPNPYRLGVTNPDNSPLWGANRAELPAPASPQDEAVIPLSFMAPALAGVYDLSLRMLHENVVWFGPTQSQQIAVVGVPPPVASNVQMPPASDADAADLVSAEIFNTGPVAIDGIGRTHRWVNATGRTLRVRKAYLWTGVQSGTQADIHLQLDRGGPDRPTQPVGYLQWDRYAEPTVPQHGVYVPLDPYLLLEPDCWLDMRYRGTLVAGSGPRLEHHLVAIWAQYAPQAG